MIGWTGGLETLQSQCHFSCVDIKEIRNDVSDNSERSFSRGQLGLDNQYEILEIFNNR
jgi:hypothetical protein